MTLALASENIPRPMETVLHKYPAKHPETGIERIDGKLMAASPDDRLHVFVNEDETANEVAESIIELATGTRSVQEIAEAICREYEVDRERAERDTERFVSQMVEAKVLVLGDSPATSRG